MQSPVTSLLEAWRIAIARATTMASRLDRRTMTWASIALAGITFLAGNLISATLLRSWTADLTSEGLYTISPGTKKALAAIDEPIDLRVYFSKKLGESAPTFNRSFERVRTLLEQYRSLSRNRLRITYLDPEPFSDAEDRAVAAGMRGVRINQDGDVGYFGLAGTNSTDNEQAIAFFAPERERFIEYDVTKLIYQLANPKKPVIGLLSTLPLDGGLDPVMGMRGQPQPPQLVMEQIRDVFDVKTIETQAKVIPADVDVLMIVQPDNLAPQTVYALDQFALRGGKILLFIDPVPEMQRGGGPMGMPAPPKFGEFEKLLKAWGVAFDPGKIAGDIAHARRVQLGAGGRPTITEYVAWLGLDKASLEARDVLSASVERLNLATAGFLGKADGGTTTVTPVLHTSNQAMQIPADSLRMMPDPVALLRNYKSEGKPLTLAARVSGDIKSAFPDGAPKAIEKPQEKAAADGTSPKPAEPAKSDSPALPPHLAAGRLNAIVIADTDILSDQFWVDVREFAGQQIAVPLAHNAAFVVGALENLSGSEALLSLRGRGIADRPFEWVERIRRNSERQFREKEQALTVKLKDVQEKLAKLEKSGDGETLILSDKDRQTIEKFRSEMIAVRRDLRDVKLALRRDIDRLGGWLKLINIAGVPLLIGLGGIVWMMRKRRKVVPPGGMT